MDKLDQYRVAIKKILTEYASVPIANGEIDCQLIFDTERVGLCPAAGIAIKL